MTFGQGLFKEGICFATSEAIMVWVDLGHAGGPVPFPAGLDEKLREEAKNPVLTAAQG